MQSLHVFYSCCEENEILTPEKSTKENPWIEDAALIACCLVLLAIVVLAISVVGQSTQ
jgi:hypothetical protein